MSARGLERVREALIVEDNEVLLEAVSRRVTGWGARVICATTLEQGLRSVRGPLDLVIGDVRLPDGQGHALFEHARLLVPRPLLVAMSGEASAAEAFSLSEAGVHAYLPKPFTGVDLERAVVRAMLREDTDRHAPLAEAVRRFVDAHKLNARQARIVELAMQGLPRKQLASALRISEDACKRSVRRLLSRCGLTRLADIPRHIVAGELTVPTSGANDATARERPRST